MDNREGGGVVCIISFDWGEDDPRRRGHDFRQGQLLIASIELTEACNYRCEWCYTASHRIEAPRHMPWDRAERLIRILADSGIPRVTCCGGEPLLYPHLERFVRVATEHGLKVHANSNGHLFTEERARGLKDAGLAQLQTNIDSLDPDVHDKVRGHTRSYSMAVEALKTAVAVGITPVCQTVVTRNNEDQLIEIFEFARSLGAQRCRSLDMMPTGVALERVDERPADYIGTAEKLYEYARATGAASIESADPLFPAACSTELDVHCGVCGAAAGGYVMIDVDGNALFCSTTRHSLYNMLDAAAESTDINAFHQEKVREFLARHPVSDGCRSCDHLSRCQGGCMTRRLHNDTGVDDFCRYLRESGAA